MRTIFYPDPPVGPSPQKFGGLDVSHVPSERASERARHRDRPTHFLSRNVTPRSRNLSLENPPMKERTKPTGKRKIRDAHPAERSTAKPKREDAPIQGNESRYFCRGSRAVRWIYVGSRMGNRVAWCPRGSGAGTDGRLDPESQLKKGDRSLKDRSPAPWCRRRDSNPHGPTGPEDFKSAVSAVPPLRHGKGNYTTTLSPRQSTTA